MLTRYGKFQTTEESLVMKRYVFVAMIVCLAIALLAPIGSKKVFSQTAPPSAESSQLADKLLTGKLPAGYTIPSQDIPCILPGNKVDIQCLIKNDPDFVRIRDEEAGLEAQAFAPAKSRMLDAFHAVETLGELEILDPNLSVNTNLACSYCHDPAAGYGNGASILSVFTGGANPGWVPITNHGKYPDNRMAKRNPQSYVYSPYYPPLQFNVTKGDFYGGTFWDGRATGFRLQNSAAEQGQDPPVDPEEMANPDTACVVWKLSLSNYKFFFEQVWGTGSLSSIVWPPNVTPIFSTPKTAAPFGSNPTPLPFTP